MKIAYLVTDPGIPVLGNKGASVHVRSITSALFSLGHDVRIFASNLDGENFLDKHISCTVVGDRNKARRRWKWVKKTVAGQNEGEDHPETQISEIIKMDIAGRAAEETISILRKDPVDLIIERLSPFGGAGMLVAEKMGIKRIVEMNAPLTEEFRLWRRLELDSVSSHIESAALLSANGIIAVSPELKNILLDLSIASEKIMVVPNGFDADLFFPAPKDHALSTELGIKSEFVVGFAGSLKKWHGVDVLLKAFAQLSAEAVDMILLVIGEGPEYKELHALAAELQILDRVIFTGRIPHRSVPAYIRLMDTAVAPYNVKGEFYFSPLKLVEYMACGIPVIACGGGEIYRLMQNRECGIHLSQTEPNTLSSAILSIYNDPPLRTAFAEQGRKIVEERTWPNIACKTMHFAENIHWKVNVK